jgi:hypothetical protein
MNRKKLLAIFQMYVLEIVKNGSRLEMVEEVLEVVEEVLKIAEEGLEKVE